MSVFKERAFACTGCGRRVKALLWDDAVPPACCGPWEPADQTLVRHRGVIDDQLEGGARWCETMGQEPVWLDGTKSQWSREINKRKLVNVVKHDQDYYARQRKQHDERLRDTGAKA